MSGRQEGLTRGRLPAKRTRWAWAVGTFFGVGLLQPGPGTYGSLAAVLLWALAAGFGHPSQRWLAVGTALGALLAVVAGVPAATRVARESGRKDPGHVVIDEVAGQLVALIGMPAGWTSAVVALLLFRLFDITKPPPVRQLEGLPAGTGIVMDDVAAGLLALLVGQIGRHWL